MFLWPYSRNFITARDCAQLYQIQDWYTRIVSVYLRQPDAAHKFDHLSNVKTSGTALVAISMVSFWHCDTSLYAFSFGRKENTIHCMYDDLFFSFLCVLRERRKSISNITEKSNPQYLSVTCCIQKTMKHLQIFYFSSHLMRKGDVPLFEYIVTSNTMGQFICLMHENTLFMKREW